MVSVRTLCFGSFAKELEFPWGQIIENKPLTKINVIHLGSRVTVSKRSREKKAHAAFQSAESIYWIFDLEKKTVKVFSSCSDSMLS